MTSILTKRKTWFLRSSLALHFHPQSFRKPETLSPGSPIIFIWVVKLVSLMRMQAFSALKLFKASSLFFVVKCLEVLLSRVSVWELNWQEKPREFIPLPIHHCQGEGKLRGLHRTSFRGSVFKTACNSPCYQFPELPTL